MPPSHHLVAATDFSESSRHAVNRGFQLAQTLGGHYTVVHALGLDAPGPLRQLLGEKSQDARDKIAQHQYAKLQDFTQEGQRQSGVTPTLRVEEGLATTTIPAQVAALGADLVLVGAQGESRWRRVLLGSTASQLLRKSRCPVLVVKNPCQGPYRRILVAVDFSASSLVALQLARTLAPQAFLVLLHAFSVPFESMLQYAGVAEAEIHHYRVQARTEAMHQLQALAQAAGLDPANYLPVVRHGDAAHLLLEEEHESPCDLVVMGKHGTHVTEELLLGSVTHRILTEGDTDLLAVVEASALLQRAA